MSEVRTVRTLIYGLGGVGQALVETIVRGRKMHAEKFGVRLAVCSLADSSGRVSSDDRDGLDDAALAAAVAAKRRGEKLPPFDATTEHRDGGAHDIVVDCTASDATHLLRWRGSGAHVVSANKKPFAGDASDFEALTRKRCRWESTVAAGVPAIAALRRLVAADDAPTRIAGALSGTLGFVMTGLQNGRPFSEIVAEAKALGYTEPDPRDDLGGVDVARKAVILARTAGWASDLERVAVEPLFPKELADLSVDAFMAALPTLDASFAAKAAAAKTAGGALRYAATVTPDGATVGLVTAPLDSPLGGLSGTDNMVEFHTAVYADGAPLVLRGAGAGAEATAAGVLADMLDLAENIRP